MSWLSNMFDRFVEAIFCQHDWVFDRKIREQNLRAGFEHDSHIFTCSLCGREKVIELPPDHI